MKVLYNWLKEFVDVTAPAADLRTRLSLAGVAIDSLEDSRPARCSMRKSRRIVPIASATTASRAKSRRSTGCRSSRFSRSSRNPPKKLRTPRASKSNRPNCAAATRRAFCAE